MCKRREPDELTHHSMGEPTFDTYHPISWGKKRTGYRF